MKIFAFLFINFPAYGQYFDTISIAKKVVFVNYLKENKQPQDALYILNYFNSQVEIDSLKLMEVKLLIDLRREKDADSLLQKSAHLFSDTSHLYCRYTLLKNHTNILIGKYNELTKPGCSKHLTHQEAWRLQLLAAALLKNKQEEFEIIFNSQKTSLPQLVPVELSVLIQEKEFIKRRKKNSFAAGLFSAVLPGVGKLYVGKPREALTAFLPVVFNLAQAAEGYYYRKFDSPHLYIFGSIATVFYVSNIYGSARSAKRKNYEFNNKIKTNVEFEITKLVEFY